MKKIICLICILAMFSNMLVFANTADINVSAKSAVLMEASTGKILYEKNPDEKLPIASVTKVMTMLLIMEAIDTGKIKIDDMVTVSQNAMDMGGSTMFLETGEQFTVSDMLKGIAVASANDGTVAMGEHIAGSVSGFITMMNEKAKELGMNNTNFVNTHGLDSEGHYSSARDVAIMSRELIKYEKIFEFTTIWMDSLRDGKTELANTNKLIRFYKGANGLKTGSTSKAGCCLSATAKRDGMQLISVVLGAPTSKERFADAGGLLDFGFANYSVSEQVAKDEVIGDVSISKGLKGSVDAVADNSFSVLIKKGDKSDIEKNIMYEEKIVAPISKGDIIGKISFNANGEQIGSINIVAADDIAKKGYGDVLSDVIGKWLIRD